MQFTLSENEIKHAVAKCIIDAGLNPGEGFPEVQLSVLPGGKKTDPVAITASVDVSIDITVGLGGGGLEVLAGKPPENTAAFEAGAQKPVTAPKTKAKPKETAVKAAVVEKAALKVDPLITSPEVKGKTVSVPVEDSPAAVATPKNLFGAPAKAVVESAPEAAAVTETTPSLFPAAVAGPQEDDDLLEEGDTLVEAAPVAVSGDTLFAPQG